MFNYEHVDMSTCEHIDMLTCEQYIGSSTTQETY